MKRLGPKTRIQLARARVSKEISDLASHGGLFARGVASEGYAGGYRDALDDVTLLLNGCVPNRRDYWDIDKAGELRP